MATHSSILAWKIPWTEEPGGLQYMGQQESDKTWQLNSQHSNNGKYLPLISTGTQPNYLQHKDEAASPRLLKDITIQKGWGCSHSKDL